MADNREHKKFTRSAEVGEQEAALALRMINLCEGESTDNALEAAMHLTACLLVNSFRAQWMTREDVYGWVKSSAAATLQNFEGNVSDPDGPSDFIPVALSNN